MAKVVLVGKKIDRRHCPVVLHIRHTSCLYFVQCSCVTEWQHYNSIRCSLTTICGFETIWCKTALKFLLSGQLVMTKNSLVLYLKQINENGKDSNRQNDATAIIS